MSTRFKKPNKKTAVIVVTAVLLCLSALTCCTKKQEALELPATFSLPAVEMSQKPAEGQISAKSAIVIEASSGEILWSKNSDMRLPMASTTKIMTALVALENSDMKKTVRVSPKAVGVEGSSVYLYAGEELCMENLLYAMLLESANDAAAAIAIEVGGSIEKFSQMMTQKARELGLENTNFQNPHGLDGEEHYTTAYDLSMIARCAMQNEAFRKIVSTHKTTIPLNKTEGVRLLINHNKLLKMYDGATGIKTGFTKKSGRCLVSSAICDGVEYICVTLNAPSDWHDHEILLDYASSLYEQKLLCDIGEMNYSLPVSDGDKEFLRVSNKEKVSAVLPRNHNEIKYELRLPQFILGNITEGERVGDVVFYLDGEAVAHTPLYAEHSIRQNQNKNKFLQWMESLFT